MNKKNCDWCGIELEPHPLTEYLYGEWRQLCSSECLDDYEKHGYHQFDDSEQDCLDSDPYDTELSMF